MNGFQIFTILLIAFIWFAPAIKNELKKKKEKEDRQKELDYLAKKIAEENQSKEGI